MPVSMTTLSGPIYMPSGVTPTGGRVSFELSSWGRQAGEALIVSGPIYANIDSNGQFSVNLFTSAVSEQTVNYLMYVHWEESDYSNNYVNSQYVSSGLPNYHKQYIGSFGLSGPGPYSISDIDIVNEMTRNSFDIYVECTALALAAQTSATNALASAVNSEASAVRVENLSSSIVGFAGYLPRASQPVHTNYKVLSNGVWYSPDWITLVGAGQSNMIGVADSTDGPKTTNPNVYVWNNAGALVPAVLGTAPFNTAAGSPNNLLFHQAARLSDTYKRPVAIIMRPVSGSPIGSWFVGQPNWDLLEAQINLALASPALWGKNKIDVFSFHLGESAHDALQYVLGQVTFPAFIRQCQTRSWSDPKMVFIAGEMLRQEDGGVAYNAIEEWRRAVAGGDMERAFLASSEGLTVNGDGTNVHFNGASLAILGQRYAAFGLYGNSGITDNRTDIRDATASMTWNGQFYTLLADAQFGPSNINNQNVVVNVIRSDIPVVFEVNSVRTEVLSITNAATLLVNSASDARVRVWYPSAMMGDKVPVAERPGVTFSNPSSNGTMRRLWINPFAPLRLLFVEGHNLLQHDLDTAHLPQSLTGMRFKSVAKLTFNGFKPSAIPPALTLLDFSGTTPVPGLIRTAIDTENTLRAGMISVTYSGLYASEGFRKLRPEDFGSNGLGVVDDSLAMARFTAWGGTLELTTGANYRITSKQVMNLPAGAVLEGNGASITLEYNDISDGLSFATGIGATIQNVIFRFPNNGGTAYYQERMLGLSTGTKLLNCQFIAAVAQPDTDDDIRDGCVRILGEDVVIDGCSFYNIYRCIQATPDASTARSRVSNTRFDGYGKGIDTGGTMTNGVLENLTFGNISAAALTDPGVNAITEASTDLTIRNIRVEGAGEHGIYLAGSVYVSGLVMTDVQVRGSGQCSIKLRRQTDFILADIHCFDTSDSNAPGTNEDMLHFECCRNGRVIGASIGEMTGNGGYEGIYVDACSDLDFVALVLRGTSSNFIYITDANTAAEASPPTLGNIRFWGLRCFNPGAVPLLNIQATGNVGPILLDGVDYRNATGSAIITNIGGVATDLVVRGNISTTGAYQTNTAGGSALIIGTPDRRYVGGVLQYDLASKKLTLFSDQFALASGQTTALHLRLLTGTAGDGAFGPAISFGQAGGSARPLGAIGSRQDGADPDQGGLAFFSHTGSTTDDTLTLAAYFTLQSDLKFNAISRGPIIRSPDGASWRLIVSNAGAVSAVLV